MGPGVQDSTGRWRVSLWVDLSKSLPLSSVQWAALDRGTVRVEQSSTVRAAFHAAHHHSISQLGEMIDQPKSVRPIELGEPRVGPRIQSNSLNVLPLRLGLGPGDHSGPPTTTSMGSPDGELVKVERASGGGSWPIYRVASLQQHARDGTLIRESHYEGAGGTVVRQVRSLQFGIGPSGQAAAADPARCLAQDQQCTRNTLRTDSANLNAELREQASRGICTAFAHRRALR